MLSKFTLGCLTAGLFFLFALLYAKDCYQACCRSRAVSGEREQPGVRAHSTASSYLLGNVLGHQPPRHLPTHSPPLAPPNSDSHFCGRHEHQARHASLLLGVVVDSHAVTMTRPDLPRRQKRVRARYAGGGPPCRRPRGPLLKHLSRSCARTVVVLQSRGSRKRWVLTMRTPWRSGDSPPKRSVV